MAVVTGSFGTYYTLRPGSDPLYQMYKAMADNEAAAAQKSQQQTASNNESLQKSAEAQAAAATEAAKIKADTASQALAWQKEQYADTKAAIEAATATAREDVNPWRAAGETALGTLTSMLEAGPGEYTQSPDYAIRLAEGEKAIERSAAARGNALSGAAVKAAQRYGADLATEDYDNFLNRYYQSLAPYQQLSGVGANAAQAQGNYTTSGANALASAGQNYVTGATNTAIYGGESTAGGITESSNVLAAYQQALAEQNAAYNAWKAGSNY